jgi:HTH-type transcriptional regulator/antitoxin HigA
MAMHIRVIKTKDEYQEALERLEVIFDARRNTPEGDELELLSKLIDNYEKSITLE